MGVADLYYRCKSCGYTFAARNDSPLLDENERPKRARTLACPACGSKALRSLTDKNHYPRGSSPAVGASCRSKG